MDAQNPSSATQAPPNGGTVEPARTAAMVKDGPQTSTANHRERYELRDPSAGVTYRTASLADAVAKADQLGSTRFTALMPDGKRTPITKTGGEWQRGRQLAELPTQPLDVLSDEPGKSAVPRKGTGVNPAAAQLTLPLKVRSESSSQAKVDTSLEKAVAIAQLEASLRERYVIKRAPVTIGPITLGHTEYRFRGDTSRIAFIESSFKLSTDTNSPSVARSMIDVAQARSWKELRVSGNEDFQRLVWLEASARGVKVVGYEPHPSDMDLLRREREARMNTRIEPAAQTSGEATSQPTEKTSGRRGGRKVVLAAIEAILVAKNVPEAKRMAVLAAASEQLNERTGTERASTVKVYDRSAPMQRRAAPAVRAIDRTPERGAPAQAR